MATNQQKLQIIIDAQNKSGAALADVSKGLDGFKMKLKDLQPAFKTMAVAGTAAFATVTAIGVSALKEYADSQKQAIIANTALENALKGMSQAQLEAGTGYKTVSSAMSEMLIPNMQAAGKAALALGYDDDIARLSFAKLFQVTGDVTQSQKDLKLAMDLSAFSGRTLEESADALTKVHAGQTRVLKEFGIQVEEGTTALDALDMVNKRVQGSAEKASKSLEGQVRILSERFNNLKEQIGASLAPVVTKLLEKLTPLIEKFTEWAEKNPELLGKILLLVGGLSALVAVVGTLGIAIIAFQAVSWPIVGVVLAITVAIGALIAAGIYLYTHWDQVKAKASEVWDSIKTTISNALQAISDFFTSIWEGIKTAFETYIYFIVGLAAMLLDLIWPGWQEGLARIRDFFVTIWNGIKDYFATAVNAIKGVFDTLKGYFQSIWGAIVEVFNWAKGEIKKAIDYINSILEPVFAMIDRLTSKLSSVGSAVKSALGAVVDKGKAVLGAKAMGGPVSSGHPYLVGENGPEIFTPATAGRISTGVGGMTLVLNITGNSFMGREGIADQIGNEILRALQLRMKLQ